MARDQSYLGNRTSTVLGRRLGGELLAMREARELTQGQAAAVLSASTAKVAKMERGWVPMRDPDIRALCELYGVEDSGAVGRLLDLAKADRERRKAKGWWNQYAEFRDLVEYVSLEAIAVSVRTWQLALIPGLLQTPDYARALCVADTSWKDPDDVDRIANARIARQQRLTDDKPLELWAIISEAALRQLSGGRDAMRAQLEHLLEVAELPNVRLQVMPYTAGSHPGLGGAFNIMSFAETGALDVVYLETAFSSLWIESAEEAARHDTVFDRMARCSLAQQSSAMLINGIRKEI